MYFHTEWYKLFRTPSTLLTNHSLPSTIFAFAVAISTASLFSFSSFSHIIIRYSSNNIDTKCIDLPCDPRLGSQMLYDKPRPSPVVADLPRLLQQARSEVGRAGLQDGVWPQVLYTCIVQVPSLQKSHHVCDSLLSYLTCRLFMSCRRTIRTNQSFS